MYLQVMIAFLLHAVASFFCPFLNEFCDEDKLRGDQHDSGCNEVCGNSCEVVICNGTIYARWFCAAASRKIPEDLAGTDFYNACLVFLDQLGGERVGMEILASQLR